MKIEEKDDKITKQTIEHAHLIISRQENLSTIDLQTAEWTAKLINGGKIYSGLLAYLTSPKPKDLRPPVPKTKSKTKAQENVQKHENPLLNLSDRQGVKSSLAKTSQQSGATSRPKKDNELLLDKVESLRTEGAAVRENSITPENDLSIERSGPKKPALNKQTALNGSPVESRPSPQRPPSNSRNPSRDSTPEPCTVSNDTVPWITNVTEASMPEHVVTSVSHIETDVGLDMNDCQGEMADLVDGSTREQIDAKDIATNDLFNEEAFRLPESAPETEFDLQHSQEAETPIAEVIFREELVLLDADFEVELLEPELTWTETCFSRHSRTRNANTILREVIDARSLDETLSLDFASPVDSSIDSSNSSHPSESDEITGEGSKGLQWAYASHADADLDLIEMGIWLWDKPNTYDFPQVSFKTTKSAYTVPAAVIVSHCRTIYPEPSMEFDGDKIVIIPHEEPWDDVRSIIGHPDFVVPSKLAEYQACEAVGYPIWRYDRHSMICRKSGCIATIADYNQSGFVCLGCGPKTEVRYCCFKHQVDDIPNHWCECGHEDLVMRCIIDQTTEPLWFPYIRPAIKEKHGYKSAALHRQRLYAMVKGGHYTLFDLKTQDPIAMLWPESHPNWQGMEQRVKRLLNVAFFDICNLTILSYLYRLLREILRCTSHKWALAVTEVLKAQFAREFGKTLFDTVDISDNSPCECEWSGRSSSPHDKFCKIRRAADSIDRSPPSGAIRVAVEDLEERHWILRAWRQQHHSETSSRRSAAGNGFLSSVSKEKHDELGPGWAGWGSEGIGIYDKVSG